MPRYKIQSPDGRTVTIEGPSPPTEADLDAIFAQLPPPQAAQSEAASDDQRSGAQRAMDAAWQAIKGGAKEAPLVAMRAANMPQDIIRGGIETAADVTGLSQNPAIARGLIQSAEQEQGLRQATEGPFAQGPEATTAEKVGRFATRAAPQAALAAMTGGASIPAQAAIQGGGQAAQTAAEGGSTGEIAASGALGTVLGAGAPYVSGAVKQLAPRVINSLIKPLEKAFRFGRDPGRGVVNEGITALSRSGLKEQFVSKLDELGGLIERSLTRPGVKESVIDVSPAISKIDDAIAAAGKRGEKLLLQRLKDVKEALTKNLDVQTGEFTTSKPMQMSPLEVHQLKRQIGEAAKWTGQAFDNEVNQARVVVYRALNDLVEKAAPGTKSLQARYADILTAKSALERTMNIGERHNLMSLPNIILGGAGYAGGGVPGALALAGARRLAGTAAAKTSAAWILGRFPNSSRALQALLRAELARESDQSGSK